MSESTSAPGPRSYRLVPWREPLSWSGPPIVWGTWGPVDGQPVLAMGDTDGGLRFSEFSAQEAHFPLLDYAMSELDRSETLWGIWSSEPERTGLITGGRDGWVREWRLGSRVQMEALETKSGLVTWGGWVVGGGGRFLATARDDGSVTLHPFGGGTQTNTFTEVHRAPVLWGVSATVDDQPYLATGGFDTGVRLFDVKYPGKGSRVLPAPHAGALGWGSWGTLDGQAVLAAGADDGQILLWYPFADREPERLQVDSGAVTWGAWGSADGRVILASAGEDGVVRFWDLADRSDLWKMPLLRTVTPEPSSLDTRTLLETRLVRAAGTVVWGRWIEIGGRGLVVTGDNAGRVRIWDPRSSSVLSEIDTGVRTRRAWGAFAVHDGVAVLATGGTDIVQFWELVGEEPVGATLPHYRSDTPTTVDELDRTGEARAIAELITARSARPPLAIGLFADWGEGKSHFLGLLQQQVEAVAKPGQTLTHGYVRQVRFNAWHYAETDLWASLVTELFAQLAAPTGSETEQRQQSRLAADLIAQRGLPERLAAAEARRDELRAALAEPAGLWDSLPEHQRAELRTLTGDSPEKVYAQAARAAAAMAGTGRVTWRLVRGMRLGTLLRLVALIALLMLAVVGVVWWLPPIGSLVAALGGVAAAIGVIREVRGFAAETRRRGSAAWKSALRYGEQQRQRLTAAAEAADAEVQTLREQMRDFTAAGQLAGLVARRDASDDYRSRLDIMSRIRQDFAHMAELLASAGSDVDAAGDSLPRIDRIAVYIDDLDRCPPARVVEMLEAVHLLLAADVFVVVVAVDPRWLLSAISAHYSDVLGDRPALGDDSAEDGPPHALDLDDESLWRSTPAQYLEKIFQVVLTLPPLDESGYRRMLRGLVGTRADQPTEIPAPTEATAAAAVLDPLMVPLVGTTGASPDDVANRADDVLRLPEPRTVERVDPFALDQDEIRLLDLVGPPHMISTPRQVKRLANSYGLLTTLRRDERARDLADQSSSGPAGQANGRPPGRSTERTAGGPPAHPVRQAASAAPAHPVDRADGGPPVYPYRCGLVLLSALVAYPALGPGLFAHLHRAAERAPRGSWADFLPGLVPQRDAAGWHNRDGLRLLPVEAAQWNSLAAALGQVTRAAKDSGLDLPEPLAAWAEWIVPVGRLSFPTGRVVSGLGRQRLPE
ncbi:hypothetical protein JIG36_10755 [Actinoplanes sp. LDG1-06]|uniref:KAP NTPase domain-containing protein n=1 Tax=Paractinoplanes ovalisporus TaxID=2810368 RepID=A0ABS2A870_9ACTN|nr:P-loop NTPase fold protein [Actinoplanes ovalisporus]MBM2616035.1 hypothetical protein [Actinoplanes ovalisporus]